jgi:hypothetical protein
MRKIPLSKFDEAIPEDVVSNRPYGSSTSQPHFRLAPVEPFGTYNNGSGMEDDSIEL